MPEIGSLPREGASTLTNVPEAVPVAKPLGSADAPSKKSRYSCLVSKEGRRAGVSLLIVLLERLLEARPAATRGTNAETDEPEEANATTRTRPRAIRDHMMDIEDTVCTK